MSAGQGPDRNGDAERLAAAIDQGRSPASVADVELARDLDIVAMLRTRGAAFDPHPTDRAQAKQRLMAALMAANTDGAFPSGGAPAAAELTAPIEPVAAEDDTAVIGRIADADPEPAPTVVAEAAAADDDAGSPGAPPSRAGRAGRHSLPTRPAGRSRASKRPGSRGLRRRVAVVGASALAALVALATLGSVASRDALPGDMLYAMKRISENTALALTFDDTARAQRHLELATTRINEVEQLVGRDSGDAADAERVETAMRDFDSSTGEGSRMLLAAEDASGPAALADLRTWASEQVARLAVLRSSLPEPAVAEADTSIALLDRLLGRTEALEARSECSEVTSNVTDDLGPLPSEGTCSPRPAVADDPDTAVDESSPTTTPDNSGTGSSAPSSGPGTSTPQESDAPDSGVLPELGPDGLPLPGTDGDGLSTSGGSDGSDRDDQVSVPLPLVPPIQLPPLLPGMPGVSIG
ncbi:DUF5667 domain-containing protein [Pseudonocardia sp.]|uniref:DUF5667 domain-containing protein n=1 Tax=Pseudonocardia sp. TaxID=60912 RepID=UPI00260BE095|nr:DUF5667 domain-containing protein [Pseudonocardia sp.]